LRIFAEAVAEGRSKAQAAALRSAKRDTMAKKLDKPQKGSSRSLVACTALRKERLSWSRRAISFLRTAK